MTRILQIVNASGKWGVCIKAVANYGTITDMQDFDARAWDQKMQDLGGGILQSAAWADFQARMGRDVVRAQSADWAWQGFIRRAKGLRYILIPYGPVVQGSAAEALQSAVITGAEQEADFVRLEPIGHVDDDIFRTHGIRARRITELDPQHTFVLDLSSSLEELRAGLDSGHRNRINTTDKRGIAVRQVKNMTPFQDFMRLMHATATHAHIVNYPESYFLQLCESLIEKGIASFYVSTVEDGKPASISLVYDWGGTRTYAHTGNDQQLNRQYHVAVSAVWRMICDAKDQGLMRFDFWGAAPDDSADHAWAGITAFKKGFGGARVRTIGTWDIPMKPGKYAAYHLYRRVRGLE